MRPKSSNNNVYTNPVKYFRNLNSKTFAEKIDNFLGIVTNYPENTDLPGAIQFRIPGLLNKSQSELVALPENPNSYIKPVPGTIIRLKWFQGYYVYSGLYKHKSIENNDFLIDILTETDLRTVNIPDYTENNTDDYNKLEFIDFEIEIPLIKEKAGDHIIRGNNNNDIILSYKDNGSPYISFLINRTISEYDTNTEGIHIYGDFDIDNEINFNNNKNPYKPKEEQDGSGVVLNFNKIRLITDINSIYISSAKEIGLSSKNKITFFTEESYDIDSPIINLGKNADESIVLGNKLNDWLGQLIDAIAQLTVGTPVGPSTPPINVAIFNKLKTQLNSILSKQNKTL